VNGQLALEVPDVEADPLSDLDVSNADRQAAARREQDRASARRPRRCTCPRPLVEVEDDGEARCVRCGHAAVMSS
jgi:hypothetical protein